MEFKNSGEENAWRAGDKMIDKERLEEVLPFGGRGFLRVHGHERCLLAARWPRGPQQTVK